MLAEARHRREKIEVLSTRPRESTVQDERGYKAVFTERGASRSQMAAVKFLDIIPRFPSKAGEAIDAMTVCHTPWIRFLERIMERASVSDEGLKATVCVCTACTVVSLSTTSLNFITPPLAWTAPFDARLVS